MLNLYAAQNFYLNLSVLSFFFQRLRTENRLLRQRVDLLEQECSNLADRLIQGQVTRAEVEEHTFAIKRELAAIKQHDLDTTG